MTSKHKPDAHGKRARSRKKSPAQSPAAPAPAVPAARAAAHRPDKAELDTRITKAHAHLSEQNRLQQALRAMEGFRDDAYHHRHRLDQAEQTLQASRDLFAELYDYAPIGYVTIDVSGVIENANHTTASMLRSERARLVGRPFLTLVAHADRVTFLDYRSRVATGRTMSTELNLQMADGRAFPVQLTTRESLLPGAGRRRCFLVTIMNLSDVRRNEAERMRLATEEQKARLAGEAKDRFLAVLSHELRTPLTPILAAVSDPQLMAEIPQTLRDTLDMIRRNIGIEVQLVEDLLDVSRVSQGKLHLVRQPTDLHQIIRETAELLHGEARNTGLELLLDLRAERHWVSGDPTRLRQVLWNLVRNAIKFTPAGGRILLRAINCCGGQQITISVRDTGIGIDPNRLRTLFSPFEQINPSARGGGLGLGLTICRALVAAHEGQIVATTDGEGSGSTFEFTLATMPTPGVARAAAAAAAAAGSAPPRPVAAAAIAPTAARSPAPASPSSRSEHEPEHESQRERGHEQEPEHEHESEPAHGPNHESRPSPAREPARAEPPNARRALHIMLVEDHPDTAAVMARLLKRQGHHVAVANTFSDALALTRDSFDLAISDISLPDGSGLDLMRRLRATSQSTRGIALSGLVSEADVCRAREAGFDAHLAKPINFGKLLAVIDTLA